MTLYQLLLSEGTFFLAMSQGCPSSKLVASKARALLLSLCKSLGSPC